MKSNDTVSLGDRVKSWESAPTGRNLQDHQTIMVRLDGRAFSSFTVGLIEPFDPGFRALMVVTARAVSNETQALLTYTQSDEITLALRENDPEGSHAYFKGRVAKILSCLASRATAVFNRHMPTYLPGKANIADKDLPTFDCRVWTVPTREDACDVFLWREMDARTNALEMVAQTYFSQRELEGKSNFAMKEMLSSRGVDFQKFREEYRRGTYLQRRTVTRAFTAEDLAALPPKHNAHKDPLLEVSRTELVVVDMPPFSTLSNPVEVVFDGCDPLGT